VKTLISTDRAAAVELLRKGEIVALPTETVYGLAADALKPIAVAKIFEAKDRPRFDPLIVHLPSRDWLDKVVNVSAQGRQLISKLADEFWPGPFTMVLPKREIAEIVRELDHPLAAPSANRFGRVSPTSAQHVLDDLGGRISLIIDAGPTQHGIESTIVAVREDSIGVLRRGPITAEQLSEFAKIDLVTPARKVSAPGQFPSHYAPKTPLRLIDNAETISPERNQRVGLLTWGQQRSGDHRSLFAAIRQLSKKQDLREAAANLFRYLRELDVLGLDLIVVERVPSRGLGAAILDRLERASHDQPVAPDMPE